MEALGQSELAEKRWISVRLERETMNFGTEQEQPFAEPTTFEAGVPGDKDGKPRVSAAKTFQNPVWWDAEDRLPVFPRSASAFPEVLEEHLLAKRVHTLPETVVLVSAHFALAGELREGVGFKCAVVSGQIRPDPGLKNHKAAVDRRGRRGRLLVKAGDNSFVDDDVPEPARRTHSRDGGKTSAAAVLRKRSVDVDIGQTIAVGEKERSIANIGQGALQAASCHGVFARFEERDRPIFLVVLGVVFDLWNTAKF